MIERDLNRAEVSKAVRFSGSRFGDEMLRRFIGYAAAETALDG